MIRAEDFVEIGIVGVDSGTVLVSDPAYVLPRATDGILGCDYEDILEHNTENRVYDLDIQSTEPWGSGCGLVANAGGDGVYRVYARLTSSGSIAQILVDFEGDLDDHEPDTYDDEAS